MKKIDRLLIINRICDDFELELQAGSGLKVADVLESTDKNLNGQDIVNDLLPELIALQLHYSHEPKTTAAALKAKYPEHSREIEFAAQQPSSRVTTSPNQDDTKFTAHKRGADVAGSIDKIGDRFTDLKHFASGGLGDVYIGHDMAVKRRVAIKLMKPGLVTNLEARQRFLNEGAITGMLEHPAIVPIYDSGVTDDGQHFYAMRLLEGQTLKTAISKLHTNKSDDFDDRQRSLIRRLAQVCDAISYAHNHGVVHRDLKPANILLGEYGEAVVIDWGLARCEQKINELKSDQDSPHLIQEQSQSQHAEFATEFATAFGSVLGTPEYMSPEQATGDPAQVGKPTDVFALGAVLYCILTGAPPLRSERATTPTQRIDNAKLGTFPDAQKTNPQVPKALSAVCNQAMHCDPKQRYQTPLELKAELENWLSDQPLVAYPDNFVDKSARFFRKYRRWSFAAASTLIAITIGSIIATSIINNQGVTLVKQKADLEAQAKVQAQTEKAKDEQLNALLHKATWSEMRRNNYESAWRTLGGVDQSSLGWIGGHLANEMFCNDAKHTIHGHAHWISCVDVAPKGDFVVSGGYDQAVYLWPLKKNGTRIENAYTKRQLTDAAVTFTQFSKSLDRIAVADRADKISIFDASLENLVESIGPLDAPISAMCLHPHEPFLALSIGGNVDESKLIFVSIDTGKTLQSIEVQQDKIASLEFDGAGSRLVTGGVNGEVKLWTMNKPKPGHEESFARFELASTFKAHPNGVALVDISDDGKLLATADSDKTACLWNAETKELICYLTGHTSKISGIDISPNGKFIATVSQDQSAIVWDSKGKLLEKRKGHAGPVNAVRFLPNGESFITAGDDQTLRKWDVRDDLASIAISFEDSNEIWCADFSPNKSTVAAACETGKLLLIDAATGAVKRKISTPSALLTAQWLKDGRLLTAGEQTGVEVWIGLEGDTEEDHFKVPSIDDTDTIWDITASPDQTRLAIVGNDGMVRIVDATSLKEVASWSGHPDSISSVEFSHDGKYLVTASDDQTLKVWDSTDYKLVHKFEGHEQALWRAVFSPKDSNLIASSAMDGRIVLWDLAQRAQAPVKIEGHSSNVAGLEFTVDGRHLVSVSDDGSVRFWEVSTGVEKFAFHEQPARERMHVSFSDDGESMVVTGLGRVDIRHAIFNFEFPYRRSESISDTNLALARISKKELPDSELVDILSVSRKVCQTYPNFSSLGIMGVAQYRLGRHEEATRSLAEAHRIEKIAYGHSDIRPYIEGYLALAYAGSENLEMAVKFQKKFQQAAQSWDDLEMEELDTEIQHAIDNLIRKINLH